MVHCQPPRWAAAMPTVVNGIKFKAMETIAITCLKHLIFRFQTCKWPCFFQSFFQPIQAIQPNNLQFIFEPWSLDQLHQSLGRIILLRWACGIHFNGSRVWSDIDNASVQPKSNTVYAIYWWPSCELYNFGSSHSACQWSSKQLPWVGLKKKSWAIEAHDLSCADFSPFRYIWSDSTDGNIATDCWNIASVFGNSALVCLATLHPRNEDENHARSS